MNISKEKIGIIAKKHKLDFVILHGSQVSGAVKGPETDVDIAIYRNGGIKAKEYLNIYSEFMHIFNGEELDLKTLHQVNPLFRFYAVRNSQLLYGDKTEFNEFKAYAYRDMVDSHSLIKLEDYLTTKYQKELRSKHD